MPMRPSPSENFEDSTSVYKVPITSHEGDAARALIRAIEVHGEGVWFLHSTSMENPVLGIEVRDDSSLIWSDPATDPCSTGHCLKRLC